MSGAFPMLPAERASALPGDSDKEYSQGGPDQVGHDGRAEVTCLKRSRRPAVGGGTIAIYIIICTSAYYIKSPAPDDAGDLV